MTRFRHLKVLIALSLACAVSASAAASSDDAPMMRYLGLNNLIKRYGGQLATGSNVNVSLVESNAYPALTDKRFTGKILTRTSALTTVETTAGHATNVGARFFGSSVGYNQRSVVTDIPDVRLYTFIEFNGVYLKNPGAVAPYGSPNQSRVSSHAYAENNNALDSIARLDYLVQRDDFLHVVDTREYSTQGNSLNAIVLTPAQGTNKPTTAIGDGTLYVAGRCSPVITGPLTGSGSDAIGQVAGLVALLVSRGKTTESHYQYSTPDTLVIQNTYDGKTFGPAKKKSGYTVRSGDTSEVVKAALMTGALRRVAAFDQGGLTIPAIADYRETEKDQSRNGLDYRYGAGMVNAYQSYRIIDAGETDSAQDSLFKIGGGIGQFGFDYDPSFGGQGGSNSRADYGFIAGASGKFVATLVWHVKIAGSHQLGGHFDPTPTLYHLSLTLTNLTRGVSVQTSASTSDNTQTIYADLHAGHRYQLSVTKSGQPFAWDYGVAWRSEPAISPQAIIGLWGASWRIDRR